VDSLKLFLDKKGSEYIEIDTQRVFKVFDKIASSYSFGKVIHVVGTNGKGSSSNYLSGYLSSIGYSVGLYTSPHILSFCERIKVNNQELSLDILDSYHYEFIALLSSDDIESLSYFEYLTLLAGFVFTKQNCDFVIFEAGLGGEFDATNVFKKDISLITKIGLDHKSFLGDDVVSIASTKLRSIDKKAVIALQDYDIVYNIANNLTCDLILTKDNINQNINELKLPRFLKDNLQSVQLVLKYFDIDIKDFSFFENFQIFGRFQKYRNNVYIDVGHNELSASAIKEELKDKKINLIFNTYKDKDYIKTLETLKYNIKKVFILEIDNNDRIENIDKLKLSLKMVGLPFAIFDSIVENEDYLVYGSFCTVEKFIRDF
jgi:dihydrofolate synthase/folylpolyglutamate synthase